MLNAIFLIAKTFKFTLVMCLLTACASAPDVIVKDTNLALWLEEAYLYKQALPTEHPDRIENILTISDPMRKAINDRFAGLKKSSIAPKMASWLIDKDGHNMQYNIEANLSPAQSFAKRQGNCLSFTILLTTMAAELGVELKYNEVDLPDVWNQDEDEDKNAGLVLYRHINAIRKTSNKNFVFDLAIQDYDASYPQRVIPGEYAVALLHNNLAIAAFQEKDLDTAIHFIKLAVSQYPVNPDIFVNLSAIFKYVGEKSMAEEALLHAIALDRNSYIAANKLERLYRLEGKNTKAKKYQRLAQASRNRNPYFQYALAERALEASDYKTAKRYIRRAQYLYKEDSRFFGLSSRIELALGNHLKALRELQTAYELAKSQKSLDKYLAEDVAITEIMKKEGIIVTGKAQGKAVKDPNFRNRRERAASNEEIEKINKGLTRDVTRTLK